jgi:hypothetical protein
VSHTYRKNENKKLRVPSLRFSSLLEVKGMIKRPTHLHQNEKETLKHQALGFLRFLKGKMRPGVHASSFNGEENFGTPSPLVS